MAALRATLIELLGRDTSDPVERRKELMEVFQRIHNVGELFDHAGWPEFEAEIVERSTIDDSLLDLVPLDFCSREDAEKLVSHLRSKKALREVLSIKDFFIQCATEARTQMKELLRTTGQSWHQDEVEGDLSPRQDQPPLRFQHPPGMRYRP